MKRYVDLSGMVENGLWSYKVLPGLENIIPPAAIETIATVKANDFFASRISLSTITGTYLESGAHIIEGAKTLDEYSIADFIKLLERYPALEDTAYAMVAWVSVKLFVETYEAMSESLFHLRHTGHLLPPFAFWIGMGLIFLFGGIIAFRKKKSRDSEPA
jgi:hypothetical protein